MGENFKGGLIHLGKIFLFFNYFPFNIIYVKQVKIQQDVENVIKIEPKKNGPLFCEIHFYLNWAKEYNKTNKEIWFIFQKNF